MLLINLFFTRVEQHDCNRRLSVLAVVLSHDSNSAAHPTNSYFDFKITSNLCKTAWLMLFRFATCSCVALPPFVLAGVLKSKSKGQRKWLSADGQHRERQEGKKKNSISKNTWQSIVRQIITRARLCIYTNKIHGHMVMGGRPGGCRNT